MNKIFGLLALATVSLAALVGCNEQKSSETAAKTVPATGNSPAVETAATPNGSKSVIVFYSQTGTTRSVADEFAKLTGSAEIELKLVNPYPSTYDSTIARTRAERENKSWPALETAKLDLAAYDTVYLGYPIMFGTFAPPIYTFLDSNDLSGKVVVPFCTYGSGGRKASAREVAELEPNANVVLSYGVAHNRVEKGTANVAEEVSAFLADMRAGKTDAMLVGGFSESRAMTAEDSAVFAAATKDYAYLNLKPVVVSTQVVAGLNYMFACKMKAFGGAEETVQVKIFKPLPNQGEPQLISVDKQGL
ncbi:flavodoxin [Fibrobacter sp.]|uniref:flavodoxin n=1 Tax=Fibrobacter sp. TaxID=35828 RepID=UPI00388E249E